MAELPGEIREQLRLLELASRLAYGGEHHFLVAEVLEDRDEIGERFVKRERIRTAGLDEATTQTVQQRVAEFVRDDVVRQARIHLASRQRSSLYFAGRVVETETQLVSALIIMSIALSVGRARPDDKPARAALAPAAAPAELAPQRSTERRVDVAAHRVDHLVMEP